MMPQTVKNFIMANDLSIWTVYPKGVHWYAFNWETGKEYFLA